MWVSKYLNISRTDLSLFSMPWYSLPHCDHFVPLRDTLTLQVCIHSYLEKGTIHEPVMASDSDLTLNYGCQYTNVHTDVL